MEQERYLIIGLGNPEDKYLNTRHNTGFRAVDFFAAKNKYKFDKQNFNSLYSKVKYKGKVLIIAKPLTYMNNSGEALYALKQFFKIDVNNILVIYDDMDTPVGSIRLKERGSSGGHNGIKSIINVLGTEEFKRIKIGIGQPVFDSIDFVLGKFNEEEEKEINLAFLKVSNAIECYYDSTFARAMSLFSK
ncbi:MAG: aminoacyl-tRNA hydrolase [Bacilli bacterium]